jgi:RNA polymerase sigma-70 factor (family 1)
VICAFRNGDEKAFADIYDNYYGPLYFFARRILDDNNDAQDIAAETFLKLWRLRENFETLQNIKAFLYITARNASFNILKQRKDYVRRHEEMSYFLMQHLNDGPSQHDEIRAEVLQRVLNEIDNLPVQCGKIVKLFFVEGSKNSKIADELGLTLQTVKNQKTRGLKLLKEALARREWQLMVILHLLSGI